MSGSTLRGRARKYAGRYKLSRDNLIHRLNKHGIPCGETTGDHNRRVLVVGSTGDRMHYPMADLVFLPRLSRGGRTIVPPGLTKCRFLADAPGQMQALLFIGNTRLVLIDIDGQSYRCGTAVGFFDDQIAKFIAGKRGKSIPLGDEWLRGFRHAVVDAAIERKIAEV